MNKSGIVKIADLGFEGNNKIFLCKCHCGNIFRMWASHYYRGSNACKCNKHNWTKERLYSIWLNMHTRCYNPNVANYKDYGARGISICKEWINDYIKFREWSLDNGYNKKLSIDRIDFDGNYEPSNCRWADTYVQARNKRNNVNITIRGERKCLKEWCVIGNINYKSAHTFISRHGIEEFPRWYLDKLISKIEKDDSI